MYSREVVMAWKKMRFLLAVFILFVCGCRISGKVTMDGIGLKDIPIALQGATSMETVTDQDGRFVFSGR